MAAVARATGILLIFRVLALTAAGVEAASTDASAPPPVEATALEVPYLPQSEALCGGAAVAMVLRYWGARAVQPTDFAALVDERRSGIDTIALTNAVTERGWRAFAFTGSSSSLRHHLALGRPIIALIQVGAGRFHYVVIVSWTLSEVVVHDPATLPARVYAPEDFETAWAGSSHWALLVLPDVERGPGRRARPADTASTPPAPPPTCGPALARALRLARGGALKPADDTLRQAASLCPESSAPWREAAGVSLLQGRPEEAASRAAEAVERDPNDLHAWQVLGTARFLARDDRRALDAWNHAGGPTLDLIRVDGLARTRYRVVTDATGLSPGSQLTASALTRARRRLEGLPTVQAARLDYAPTGDGLVDADAGVVERPLMPISRLALVGLGARAAVDREVAWYVASATGGGELVWASWRWWEERPRATVGITLPLSDPLHGVLRVYGAWERQAYLPSPETATVRTERRSLSVALSDWTASGLAWQAGFGVDRWLDRGTFAGIALALDKRLARDHIALGAEAAGWAGSDRFGRAALGAAWRSTSEPVASWRWHAVGRAILVSDSAPPDLWAGAGTGHARDGLLRAHPLLVEDEISGPAFGRRLVHGTLEASRDVSRIGLVGLRAAAFVDAARAWRGFSPGRAQVDVGAGLRIGVAGRRSGLRVDYAHGLADGANAVSIAWNVSWPWPTDRQGR